MNKKNIALVMGGFSGEHDISINSGNQVYENLDHEKYNIYKIVIDRTGWYCLKEDGSHTPVNRDNFTVDGTSFDLAFIIIHGPVAICTPPPAPSTITFLAAASVSPEL